MRKVSMFAFMMLFLLFISLLITGASSIVDYKLSNQRIENSIQGENDRAQMLSYPIKQNWLDGWAWRKSHFINDATGAGSDYQIQITVINGTGADSDGTVYVNGKCQADFGDIRFTADDGTTLLDYWLESKYEGENATFWVKVSADLSSASQNIYIYHGNVAVSSTSSFDNTFIFGDPFDNSSLDTSRWTAVDGVTAYSVNSKEHYLEVTNMTTNQGTGVGFHSRNFSMPSNWIVQDAYSDEGFVMYHESEAPSDMFGQVVSLQNSTNVGSHGGVAYVMVFDSWFGDSGVADAGLIGSDGWSRNSYPPMPYTTRWTMKRTSDGLITLTQDGVDRIASMNNDTIDRMTWELERYDYPGAGFGIERLYAFVVRKYVNPEPSQGGWGSEEHRITVPDDYPTIQAAINAANDGDTVFVRNGTYYEQVVVNKAISLIGEDALSTIINGGNTGRIVQIQANGVNMSGFTVEYSDNYTQTGRDGEISLQNANNCSVFSNIVINSTFRGIALYGSSFNNISNNIVEAAYLGTPGIEIFTGSNGNLVSGNCLTGGDIDDAFGSNNNLILNNSISNNPQCGILFYSCNNNLCLDNFIENVNLGIRFDAGNGAIGNTVMNCNYGLQIYSGSLSVFYHNNFINNTHVYNFITPNNKWDNGYPSGGNYWSDYVGTDLFNGPHQNETGSDKIGDSPYVIDANNVDNYPLMSPYVPFENQTIYIRADGSVDPSGAPILRQGDLYTLTDNITCNADGIVIETDSIVVDGAGYTLQGNGTGNGIDLSNRNNVTIKNTNIENFDYATYLENSSINTISGNNISNKTNGDGIYLGNSSNNIISGNNATAQNNYGIMLDAFSSKNTVSGNNVANNQYGIALEIYCSNNSVSGNNITNNAVGIAVLYSSKNYVSGNNVTDNDRGIWILSSSCNSIVHNNFVNNFDQARTLSSDSANILDDGYPSGGNYWSDYNGTDLHTSLYQNVTGSDGLGDTSYVINSNNTDNYPLMKPYPWNSHDVGVTYIGEIKYPTVIAFKTFIWSGSTLHFDTFIMNYGGSAENVNVTAYANGTIIDQEYNVSLAEHNSIILTMQWNSTGFSIGLYNITVYAEPVIGESDLTDNARSTWMHVYIFGDINGDGKVDIRDIALLAKAFGQTVPPANPDLDVNQDWKIDIRDIAVVAKHFGEHM